MELYFTRRNINTKNKKLNGINLSIIVKLQNETNTPIMKMKAPTLSTRTNCVNAE